MMRLAWLLLVPACAAKPDVLIARKLPAALQADAAAVVAANNALALDLYARTAAGTSQNAVASPFSVATALTMLDAGAAGNTDTELRTALHATLPGAQLHSAYGALLTSLDTGRSYGAYDLATADRVFGQQGFAFEQSYLDTTKRDYHAPLQSVDFGDPEAARSTINGWVSSQTDARIPELFPQSSIDGSTKLVLANAIVFKGTWDKPFDASKTAPGSFHVAGGVSVTVPLMHASIPLSFGSLPNATVGVLPFHGKDLSLVVIVPHDPDGLPAVEAALSAPALVDAINKAVPLGAPSEVTLPKFSITQNQDLIPVLQDLGIHDAFNSVADFSGIDGAHDLQVDTVFHDAMITVDEQGAEAAAGTGVGVVVVSAPPPLTADHSFVFVLYDHVTGSILFMGRLLDPTQP